MQDFADAKTAGVSHLQQRQGIGTLQERSLHAALKYWFEPDEQFHEVKLDGGVADIFDGHRVVEIQTRNLASLRPKLKVFLPQWPVTVVHPITWHKRLIWVEPESGETSKPRKSPRTGCFQDAYQELYGLLPAIGDPNLTVILLLLDTDEYRRRDGWSRDGKKGSHRVERVPTALGESLVLCEKEDYRQLMPPELAEPFTVQDFAKASRLSRERGSLAVNFLLKLGLLSREGKKGNAFLYRQRFSEEETDF